MLNQRSDKLELLRIAESVATEKSIDKVLQIAGKKKSDINYCWKSFI